MTTPETPNVMACVYGKPKRKKTSDALASFPMGLFIGVPAAIKLVAENELGFTPAVYPTPPQTLDDLVALLGSLNPAEIAEQYGAVVIDDTSHICKQSMLKWQAESPKGRSGKPDRFYQYQMLSRRLLELAGISRHLQSHLVMTFHERSPGTNSESVFSPGGPDVPSRNQVETLPSWCDINVRAIIDPLYPDPWFPACYYVDPTDPDWITGDRTGVCTDRTPANLREILQASQSGYRLSRIPGLEWQDEIADAVSSQMSVGEAIDIIVSRIARGHQNLNSLHVRWACQDGIARGVLTKQLSRGLFDFTVERAKQTNGGGLPLPPPPPLS